MSRIQGLERYITDNVVRHGNRLNELEKKITNVYQEFTSTEAAWSAAVEASISSRLISRTAFSTYRVISDSEVEITMNQATYSKLLIRLDEKVELGRTFRWGFLSRLVINS